MKKIALIIPYYGKLNNYFEFWLKSAEFNPTIDFYFITDININLDTNKNIYIVNKTFKELKAMVQELFDFKIKLDNYYKLCDYKPIWGKIFENEFLKDYDYWGYCDVDLILGDIRNFITDNILSNNDVILSHGHFMLYRNIPYINNLFTDMISQEGFNYKQTFTTNYVTHFDEHGGIYNIIKKRNIKLYDENIFADINAFKREFKINGRPEKENVFYKWHNGKLTEYSQNEKKTLDKTEVMYVHIQKRVMEISKRNDASEDEMSIVPNTIFDYNISEQECLSYCYGSKEYEKQQINNLRKRQIKRILQGAFIVRFRRKFGI